MAGIASARKSLFSANYYCLNPHIWNKMSSNHKSGSISMVPRAKNGEEDDGTDNTSTKFNLNISSSKLFMQSAISLVAFGFVDAGYSGDWSRIGAISKETEELCKNLAFVVVPLAIFLIYTLSANVKEE